MGYHRLDQKCSPETLGLKAEETTCSHLILGKPMVWEFLLRQQKPLLDLSEDPFSRGQLCEA
jgi:hypothetical protein